MSKPFHFSNTGRFARYFAVALFSQVVVTASFVSSANADDRDLCNHSARDSDASIPACTRLLEHVTDESNLAGDFNNRGVAKVIKGDLDSAIADFNSALDKNPNLIDAIKNRGLARKLQNDANSAIADFTRALRLDQKNPDLFNLRGAALLDKEEFDRAIADFDRAIALDPNYVKAFINRGQSYYFKRNFDRAIADFDAAAHLAPAEPLSYVNRAMARLDKGDFKNAIADYDQAIKFNPKDASFYSRRGEAWRLQGDLERSLADHDLSLKMKVSEESYNNRALAYKDQGKLNKALADCDEAILLNPAFEPAYANRGLIRRLVGDLVGSRRDLDKAVGINPHSAIALAFRGDTLRELGESDRALMDFNEALANAPDFVPAYAGRGLTYEKKGDLDRARADYQKATQLSAEVGASLAKPAQELARTHLKGLEVVKPRQVAQAPAPTPVEEPKFDPGTRVALVIGNSSYQRVPSLPNSKRDAQAMEAAFRKVGFTSVISAFDAPRSELLAALRKFQAKVTSADWAVIYYAGHGIEIGGQNYLIPVDAKLLTDTDVADEAISLERLMHAMEGSKRLRLRVVILDACRDNAFVSAMNRTLTASRSVERGLARVEPSVGTLVFYATRDGQIAQDGSGEHSPFTQALLDNIARPNIEINMLFRRVRSQVMTATGSKQEPFYYGSLSDESYYFAR